jgi:hypothetical protein
LKSVLPEYGVAQATPIAFANLLEEELEEVAELLHIPSEDIYDPCISACTVLVLFVEWYSLAR